MAVIIVEGVATAQNRAGLIGYLTGVLASGEADALCEQETVRLAQRPGVLSAEAFSCGLAASQLTRSSASGACAGYLSETAVSPPPVGGGDT
jgi:hypothetical protein